MEGWTKEEAAYHLWLLIQGELIAGKCNRDQQGNGFACYRIRLTWAGHDFLASIRSDTVLCRIRSLLKEKAVDLSFKATKAAALKLLEVRMQGFERRHGNASLRLSEADPKFKAE
ncbi:DUF2513 domain-containing protein [Neisseria bergeri]|uniref:DUF2513 domain-containing protein n=1 Tax=Neisseria bergeri TaxID=1906581 RepID=UPI000E57D3DA|nr:DUF2513 domain-containing protein [Neisseria bergeri]